MTKPAAAACWAVLMLVWLQHGAAGAPLGSASRGQEEPTPAAQEDVQLEPDPDLNCPIQEEREYQIYFDYAEAEVGPQSQPMLERTLAEIRQCPFSEIVLTGHADRSGSATANVGLSQARANNVRDAIVGSGIPEDSITTQAFGESRPAVETGDGARDPMNRRVDVRVRTSAPAFSLSMPTPSERHSIPRASFGGGTATLRDVDLRLRSGLKRGGYREPTYFAVNSGYAMVVRMERRQDDAAPWPVATERWNVGPVPPLAANAGFLRRLMAAWGGGAAHAGRYRMYVFVVTTADVRLNGRSPTEAESREWLNRGRLGLPANIAAQPFTADHDVHVLVYDYRRRTVSSPMELEIPSPHDAPVHLQRSRIIPL